MINIIKKSKFQDMRGETPLSPPFAGRTPHPCVGFAPTPLQGAGPLDPHSEGFHPLTPTGDKSPGPQNFYFFSKIVAQIFSFYQILN